MNHETIQSHKALKIKVLNVKMQQIVQNSEILVLNGQSYIIYEKAFQKYCGLVIFVRAAPKNKSSKGKGILT